MNLSDDIALFEATHAAPKYTGQDKVNPGFNLVGGNDAVTWLERSCRFGYRWHERCYSGQDRNLRFARLTDNATEVSCSAFGDAIIEHG